MKTFFEEEKSVIAEVEDRQNIKHNMEKNVKEKQTKINILPAFS